MSTEYADGPLYDNVRLHTGVIYSVFKITDS